MCRPVRQWGHDHAATFEGPPQWTFRSGWEWSDCAGAGACGRDRLLAGHDQVRPRHTLQSRPNLIRLRSSTIVPAPSDGRSLVLEAQFSRGDCNLDGGARFDSSYKMLWPRSSGARPGVPICGFCCSCPVAFMQLCRQLNHLDIVDRHP